MAKTVVPHCAAMPLNVSPHWTVIRWAQFPHASAPPADPNDATRIVSAIKNWKILFVTALSLQCQTKKYKKTGLHGQSINRILRKSYLSIDFCGISIVIQG